MEDANPFQQPIKILTYVGFGIFLWLNIQAYGVALDLAFRDLFIFLGFSTATNIMLGNLLIGIMQVLVLIFSLRWAKSAYENRSNSISQIVIVLLVLLIVAQVFQYIYQYAIHANFALDYTDNMIEYFEAIREMPYLNFIRVVKNNAIYILAAILALRN